MAPTADAGGRFTGAARSFYFARRRTGRVSGPAACINSSRRAGAEDACSCPRNSALAAVLAQSSQQDPVADLQADGARPMASLSSTLLGHLISTRAEATPVKSAETLHAPSPAGREGQSLPRRRPIQAPAAMVSGTCESTSCATLAHRQSPDRARLRVDSFAMLSYVHWDKWNLQSSLLDHGIVHDHGHRGYTCFQRARGFVFLPTACITNSALDTLLTFSVPLDARLWVAFHAFPISTSQYNLKMRSTLFLVSVLAGAVFASNVPLRRRSVNVLAGGVAPTTTPAPVLEAPDLKKRQASTYDILSSILEEQSIYDVLATALPLSFYEIAITDPGAVSSILSSEFAAGETPSWYEALPADVKTYLETATGGLFGDSTEALSYSVPSISIPAVTDASYAAELSSILALYSYSFSNPLLTAVQTTDSDGTPATSVSVVTASAASATNTAVFVQQQKSSSGLSTGAKIGIGVGVPVAVLGIGAIAGVFLIMSHRRRKQRNAANSITVGNFEAKPVGMPPAQPQYPGQQMQYYPHGQVVELEPQNNVPELQSAQRPLYEMQG
ncbi:uncharacterized protein BDZ99DRAFT_556858 [Mytilinidion resinicola]|uniref:Uncharacterized protein n=1 Tax=Mytilinidion resinicola TaxID=574789 RepID=A0A6A6YX24_9PEZI|nr:uncharacterized protein BDZ99DRAFT_556858 [Mytilinidion resinicola]KAF2813320.1 hypothetical protein BDZ99DRAFT_556858 [Mytilinidion resinicola]